MPVQGGGRSFDIIRQLAGNVINIFNKRPMVCTAPCDGMLLRMHYQWTFWCMLGSFSAIWFSWFHRDVITCASHYNAETQVRLDYINICLSYPFLVESDGSKRYILYYRWIHWVLLLMAALYYIPHKISKVSENAKIKKLFEDLSISQSVYDDLEGKKFVHKAYLYLYANIRTHNGLFYKYVVCNVVALIIDIVAFNFFDFVFQGRFWNYGVMVYPFNRNVEEFDDPMSLTFPPFVKCELTESYKLTNKRHEVLGCHLTVMELYEKIFFVLWIWLILLAIMQVFYLIYLCFLSVPWARLWILRIAKPYRYRESKTSIRQLIEETVSNYKIGDVYLLYRLRQHFTHAMYLDLISQLSQTNPKSKEEISIDYPGPKGKELRSRMSKSVKSPSKYQDNYYEKQEKSYLPNSSILVD